MTTTCKDLFNKHRGSAGDYARAYAVLLSELLQRLDYEALGRIAGVFDQARHAGRTIYFMGNGGSASTASHFVTDLSHGAQVKGQKPFRAVGLSDNVSFISAIGNDLGYEQVFLHQLRCVLQKDDVVVVISASGNSPNIVAALDYANAQGAITVGLLGFDGGKALNLCRHVQLVATPRGEYGPVEDAHLIMDHMLGTYFQLLLREGAS